jgi:hypothetical protein
MTVIREVDGKWRLSVATVDLPLQKGLRFLVDSKALERKTGTTCQLLEWQYRITSKQEGDPDLSADLELIVEERQPGLWESWFARWSDDAQNLAPMITAGLTCMVAAAVGYTLYIQPDLGWAFAGRHVRTIGGWTVFLLFGALLPWKLGLYKGQASFRKNFFNSFLVLTAWVLLALWLMFSALPGNFGGSNADYAAYARALAQKSSTSYWPLLVAALPWLSVGFKLFGMDIAEKTAEGLEKAAVKDK